METTRFYGVCCVSKSGIHHRNWIAGGVGADERVFRWTVPTKGSHPHDPLAAADGTIWYTGQMASVLGRLNPRTGAFREYRTPDSGPHGLAHQEGNIWFTGNFAGLSANWIRKQARSLSIV